MDPKPRHGRFRVQMDIILLCAATSTRPQALIESSSAKGSNKALSYEHIEILRVPDKYDWNQTTTIARVSLVHIKNSGGKGRRSSNSSRNLIDTLRFCVFARNESDTSKKLAVRDTTPPTRRREQSYTTGTTKPNASSTVSQTSCANGKRIRLFSIFTTPSTIMILKGS